MAQHSSLTNNSCGVLLLNPSLNFRVLLLICPQLPALQVVLLHASLICSYEFWSLVTCPPQMEILVLEHLLDTVLLKWKFLLL